jgi:hypothetical protein
MVESRHPELSDCLRYVADVLWPSEGVGQVHQAALQDFLWLDLPRDHPVEAWAEMVRAATAILEELGFGRLAAIAQSSQTVEVLDAWEKGMTRGYASFRSAREASGVQPIDTEVLAWEQMKRWRSMRSNASSVTASLSVSSCLVRGAGASLRLRSPSEL